VESQSPVRLYCAYTSLVDQPTFARLWEDVTQSERPLPTGRKVEIVDHDIIFNHPSLAWGGRIAGLVPTRGKRIPALLYAVDAQDWHALELAEEFPDRVPITVRVDMDGVELRAQAFTTRISQSTSMSAVSKQALDILIRGAEAAGFPAEYIERLRHAPENESLFTADVLLAAEGGATSAR
jgi:AIG2-like family